MSEHQQPKQAEPTPQKRFKFLSIPHDYYDIGAKLSISDSWFSFMLCVGRYTLVWEYDRVRRGIEC